MASALILVRHPPVVLAWQKRCYGQSDPGLSRTGQAMVAPLVDQLAALAPNVIIHSDMQRTRAIALPLGAKVGVVPIADPLWRERDFGSWEGQSWNAIYRATGNAMDGMIDAPDTFRPGNTGETTRQLMDRAAIALASLPRRGCIVVISHGGPIACVRAAATSADFQSIADLVPPAGSVTVLQRAML